MLFQNFAYILQKKADSYADKVAVVEPYNGKEYTYLEMCQRVSRLAHALLDIGIGRGDRVLSITRNTVEHLDILFAVSTIGAVLLPVNYRLSSDEILRIANDGSPKAMFFDSEFNKTAKVLADNQISIKNSIMFAGNGCDWASEYESLMKRYPEESPPIVGEPEDTLTLLYTAGSTGRPKGVPIKQRNWFFKAQDIVGDMGITRQDTTLTILPLFHVGGMMLYTLSHILVGAKVVLQRQFDAEETFRLIQQYKVTDTFLMPAMAKMMIQVPNWEKYDLSSLRFVGTGGEPVPERITEAFAKYNFTIFNSYGLTETTGEMTFLRPEQVKGKSAHCIGKSRTCGETKIVDSTGKELGPNQEGEIVVRGPTVVDSYWQRPEETAKAFRDGWLYTGDKGIKDSEGFYYFLGRTDDMIISGGENIYPAEVEQVILNHPKVADVAVLGVPDEQWGQTVKAIIAPKKGEELTEDEVTTFVKQHLASFKKPRIIEFVSELPKGATGKLDRKKIKEIYMHPQK